MAKAKKAKKEAKAKPENALKRITLRTVLGEQTGEDQHCRIYGVAKKALVKDTLFGMAHGLKGSFEVRDSSGKVFTSKQAFLGDAAQEAIVAKLNGAEDAIKFGVELTRKADNSVDTEFFVEPGTVDVLESLREAAAAD